VVVVKIRCRLENIDKTVNYTQLKKAVFHWYMRRLMNDINWLYRSLTSRRKAYIEGCFFPILTADLHNTAHIIDYTVTD